MFTHDFRKIHFITGLIAAVLLACSVTALAAQNDPQRSGLTKRIAVVSFHALTPEEGTTVFCPVCHIGSSGGGILDGSEKIVEEIFVEKLGKVKGIELIPSEKVQSVNNRISSEKLKRTAVENLKIVGSELGSDFIAVGYVYRYTERTGYKYSTSHPASVVFEIHLLKTDDGSILWRGFFDKTQKSLMENILDISSFFKGGAKWITARQLTEQGMDDVLKTFPDFQK